MRVPGQNRCRFFSSWVVRCSRTRVLYVASWTPVACPVRPQDRAPPQRVDHVEEGPQRENSVEEPPQHAQTTMLRRVLNVKITLRRVLNIISALRTLLNVVNLLRRGPQGSGRESRQGSLGR